MSVISMRGSSFVLLAALALPVSGGLSAQQWNPIGSDITVNGIPPADLTGLAEGPVIEGFISARKGERMQVTGVDGTRTVIGISEATVIKANGGFLGLNNSKLGPDSLLNGLPVTVKTVMIRNGTEQGFAEQTAATEALRGRMGDIDKYNIKGTTNVYFDTGKWKLSPRAEAELCSAASQAEAMDNALLLVVGYTDSVGGQDYNQVLSERRAGRVVNHLQQACGWKPYRMLTPTGMAEADPTADNSTAAGRAQNRRVSVNILVSKGLDGL